MFGVAMSEPKHPSWAKPVSSSTMTTTLGAPGVGDGLGAKTGVESAMTRPVPSRLSGSGIGGCAPAGHDGSGGKAIGSHCVGAEDADLVPLGQPGDGPPELAHHLGPVFRVRIIRCPQNAVGPDE